jgi:hypothetical protein
MKISLFNQFGALNSAPVFEAIAHGLRAQGHTVVYHDSNADVAVVWSMLWTGRMQANREVYRTYQQQGKSVIIAEVGMLQRGKTWKLGVNGTGISSYNFENLIPNRAAKLNLTLQPWQSGTNIVVAMQRQDSEQWAGQPDIAHWLASTVAEIKKYTDRPVVVRPHPRKNCSIPAGCLIDRPQFTTGTYDNFDYYRTLGSAHCVVNWNSGPGPQALIAGVPAFVGPDSLASPIADWGFSQIENPARPDRAGWLEQLAHTEWTINEIATGYPLQRLLRL